MPLSDFQKQCVQQRVLSGQAIPCLFGGQRLLLDASGILFWPKHNLLIFSDLHFEKASFLSQFANPLPRIDTQDTVKRMLLCIEVYRPEKVVCLGDSLHDENAINRMPTDILASINSMVEGLSTWYWVLGNHDPDIPKQIKGKRAEYLQLDNLLLVHEPEILNNFDGVSAQIIGHFHPKTRKRLSKHYVRGKCFLKDETKLLMPAFGSYTGGLDIEHEVLQALVDDKNECYMLFNHKLFLV